MKRRVSWLQTPSAGGSSVSGPNLSELSHNSFWVKRDAENSSRNKKFNFRFGEIYCTCIKHPYKKSLRLLFSTLRKTFQVFENRTHSPKHAKLQNFLADPCLQFNRKCSWVNPSNYQRKVSFTFKFLFPLGFYKAEKTRFFSKFLQKLSKN